MVEFLHYHEVCPTHADLYGTDDMDDLDGMDEMNLIQHGHFYCSYCHYCHHYCNPESHRCHNIATFFLLAVDIVC